MFVDKAKIFVKAGNGGNGAISFHREKYVTNGGPDGGDGGNGGSVYLVCDPSMNTLLDYKFQKHFRATDGAPGSGANCKGAQGQDIFIKVPKGTVVRDAETGGIIADMYYDGEQKLLLQGGKGGKGNARFALATRQAPHFAQKGVITVERTVTLELKTIADVGLCGFPNVGKSTLLSVITSAKPKIANYHFTTLSPNLGVVKCYDDSFVVADIPGLIEGASEGAGLGHEFLRHIERVRLLVHVIDMSGSEGRDPVEDFNKINAELENYSFELSGVPQIVVGNKADLPSSEENAKIFKEKTGKEPLMISAVEHKGLEELIKRIYDELQKLPKPKPLEFTEFVYEEADKTSFEIARDDDGAFVLFGGLIDALSRNIVLSDYESFRYFQRLLKDNGIIKALRDAGAKEGDTVRIYDAEFDFVE